MKRKDPKEYRTEAEPRAMIGEIPVFCAYDELLDIGKAVPNPKNPNQHPKKQIELLAKIIKAQGWRQPITISNRSGLIVKGHGRLQAAILLGCDQVPVDFQNYATEAEEIADLTADNRIAELADMSDDLLGNILSEIDPEEFPIELSGYTEDELSELLDGIAEEESTTDDQDEEHEQTLPPMSKPGDLWLLGEHRLICGDATDEATIERLMNGEKGAMVHTDPPYGVAYVGGRDKTWAGIKNDETAGDDLYSKLLVPAFRNMCKYTIDKAGFYIWYASSSRRDFEDAMTAVGLSEYQSLVWVKNNIQLGRMQYQYMHEPCFYASKNGEPPNFYGDRKQQTVWRVTTHTEGQNMTVIGNGVLLTDGSGKSLYITDKAPKGKKVRTIRMSTEKPLEIYQEDQMDTVWKVDRESGYLHPTQKPVELPRRAIENSSQPGEIVIDLFGGSGSTLIAAERTGRKCYITELTPEYCDVIVYRYVTETGNVGVTCVRDGQEFAYIDLVRQWAKENGKEEEVAAMKTPVVIIKKIVSGEADTDE